MTEHNPTQAQIETLMDRAEQAESALAALRAEKDAALARVTELESALAEAIDRAIDNGAERDAALALLARVVGAAVTSVNQCLCPDRGIGQHSPACDRLDDLIDEARAPDLARAAEDRNLFETLLRLEGRMKEAVFEDPGDAVRWGETCKLLETLRATAADKPGKEGAHG